MREEAQQAAAPRRKTHSPPKPVTSAREEESCTRAPLADTERKAQRLETEVRHPDQAARTGVERPLAAGRRGDLGRKRSMKRR